MEKGYKNIFLGIFLATFNIRIGIIQIVPAFVGWIVALNGINNIRNENDNEYYEQAARYGSRLVFLSLLGSLLELLGIGSMFEPISSFFIIIVNIFEFLTISKIIEATSDYFRLMNKEDLCLEYEGKKKSYSILTFIMIIGLFISLIIQNDLMMQLCGYLAIIIRIYVMIMVNRVRNIEMGNI